MNEKESVETNDSNYAFFSSIRRKMIRFAEANPGNVVGFESVQKQTPYRYDDLWVFQETDPVHRSRFVLQLPSAWEFKTIWANHSEEKPQTTGSNQYVWEIDDIPAIEIEPYMPPWTAVAGHMSIKYYPADPALRSKSVGSWKEIGAWYDALITPRRVATPELKQKVVELTAGKPDMLEKIKSLAVFSQQKIRYAAIEIGIGGNQPHAAPDVLAHGYGDCKDKATLLNTMLQEIGVEAYNVMISPSHGVVRPDFPMLYFGHSITAIRLPDSVPDESLYAVVKNPTLGRLLFFDPTDEYVPLGYLPTELQGNYSLVVTHNGGELVALPVLPPATNRLIRPGKITLGASGSLDGDFQEIRWGAPAQERREQFLTSPPAKRGKVFEEFLGRTLSDFTLTKASIDNLEQYDLNLILEYRVLVDGYAKTVGNLLIVRPRVVGSQGWSILSGKPRKYPIEFREATRQDDVFDITLPAGYVVDELPKPVNAECAYGMYKSKVEVEGNTLHYTRTYEIKDVYVPTQKLDEVKSFLNQIAADERSSAVLRRAN